MSEHNLKIVLVSPEIPWNTGAIGRTCVALDMELIIIKPTNIDLENDAAVKRSGLDYWEHVKLTICESWDDFLEKYKPQNSDLFFHSTKAKKLYYDAPYSQNSFLIFGSETKGLAEFYHQNYSENFYKLPMLSEHIRSLNLANTATAVAFEAIRRLTTDIINIY
jgi:tRNA (cytidine/uridine-2'-O-)-methyltransferase